MFFLNLSLFLSSLFLIVFLVLLPSPAEEDEEE
jgi:hypothetical protein